MFYLKNLLKCLFAFIVLSTTLVCGQDLKSVKVDELSDAQVEAIQKKALASGMTQDQLISAAQAKGMSADEIEKLKKRIDKLGKTNEKKATTTKRTRENKFEVKQQKNKKDKKSTVEIDENDPFSVLLKEENPIDTTLKVFGSYLFTSKNLTFEPSLNIPTPQNYQIGAGDEIIIDIWGASQQSYQLTVAPEGYIFIENVGPVYINGLTIDKASKQIIGRLSTIYSGLKSYPQTTFAQVNIGSLRSIKVNLVGEVEMPGSYTLPSLATVFNALYAAGGPSKNGTYRDIVVKRENKTVANVDLYDFLINGEQASNIRLQDQDVIIVRPYVSRIQLTGEVKNPAIFELKETETLADLLKYAGGFTDKAYQNRLKITRKTDKEYAIADVAKEDYLSFQMKDGDSIHVEPIINRFANKVEITGAVFRPGKYELTDKLTIKLLLDKADGLKEDAFTERAVLYRLESDLSKSSTSVNIKGIVNGSSADVELKNGDQLRIFSIFELEEEYDVKIDGEIQLPETYPYFKNMTLSDLIATAGGFKESASLARIEVARRIKNDGVSVNDQISEIQLFTVDKNLNLNNEASNFVLMPFDQVYVRRSPGYEEQTSAKVEGEVLYPGMYVIQNKEERISDLIKRAGGFTDRAYIKGAKLVRKLNIDEKERLEMIKRLKKQEEKDTSNIEDVKIKDEEAIGIDLQKIINNPHSKYDLLLQDKDKLIIPKELQTVKVSGALLYPNTVRYDRKNSMKNYISMAGGFSEDAKKNKIYVIYANGSVDKTSSFLFFKFYPKVEPGAEIIIPKKSDKRKMSPQESLGLITAMSSLALVLVAIVNATK